MRNPCSDLVTRNAQRRSRFLQKSFLLIVPLVTNYLNMQKLTENKSWGARNSSFFESIAASLHGSANMMSQLLYKTLVRRVARVGRSNRRSIWPVNFPTLLFSFTRGLLLTSESWKLKVRSRFWKLKVESRKWKLKVESPRLNAQKWHFLTTIGIFRPENRISRPKNAKFWHQNGLLDLKMTFLY